MKFEIEVNSGAEALELMKFLRTASMNSPAHELAAKIETAMLESFDSHVFADRIQKNARDAFLKKQGLDVDMDWLAEAVSTAKLPKLSARDIEVLEEYGYNDYRSMPHAQALAMAETLHTLNDEKIATMVRVKNADGTVNKELVHEIINEN